MFNVHEIVYVNLYVNINDNVNVNINVNVNVYVNVNNTFYFYVNFNAIILSRYQQ